MVLRLRALRDGVWPPSLLGGYHQGRLQESHPLDAQVPRHLPRVPGVWRPEPEPEPRTRAPNPNPNPILPRVPGVHRDTNPHPHPSPFTLTPSEPSASASPGCQACIEGLLQREPAARLGGRANGSDIKEHAFFQPMVWSELLEKKV